MQSVCILLAVSAFAQDPTPKAIDQQHASIAQQRESVRKQAAAAATWLVPWDPAPPPQPACEAIPSDIVEPLIANAAKTENLEPKLLRAVIEQESGYHACAISSKGAMGLMQLMPATIDELKVQDPFDPKQNIVAGAKFLKQMLDRFQGNLPQALGAYNAGPSAVDQAKGIPDISETREYVDAILGKMGITPPDPPKTPTPKPTGN